MALAATAALPYGSGLCVTPFPGSRASCKTHDRRSASPLRPISELEFRSMEPPCSSFNSGNGLKAGLPLIHPEFCKRLSIVPIIFLAFVPKQCLTLCMHDHLQDPGITMSAVVRALERLPPSRIQVVPLRFVPAGDAASPAGYHTGAATQICVHAYTDGVASNMLFA